MYDIIHAIELQLEREIAMTIISDATFMTFAHRFASATDTTVFYDVINDFNKASLDLNKQVDFIGRRDLLIRTPKRRRRAGGETNICRVCRDEGY